MLSTATLLWSVRCFATRQEESWRLAFAENREALPKLLRSYRAFVISCATLVPATTSHPFRRPFAGLVSLYAQSATVEHLNQGELIPAFNDCKEF